jgi:hypothetical protein
MKKQGTTPSTQKVRRELRGGKRGIGHRLQQLGRKVRRPDPRSISAGAPDPALTGVSGLVEFGAFLQDVDIPRVLGRTFGRLKQGGHVVYPMAAQMQLLLDASVAGEGRIFGIESLAADPLFVRLAGGSVPSIDTLYRDLARFDDAALADLETCMAEQTLVRLRGLKPKRVHLDIDTTVTPLFGNQEGALLGHNPRHRGRPSFHPILARVAEVDGVVGALLRPGDHGFGANDVPTLEMWIRRVRAAVGRNCVVVVRIDAAADCTELMAALQELGVHFVIKARITPDIANAIALHTRWHTVVHDAFDKPTRQVATVTVARKEWASLNQPIRVIALRSRDRDNGKQVYLWNDLDFTVQAYLTSDWLAPEDEVAATYNDRAGIEPLIGELKGAFAIGKASSDVFGANHAAFLLKLLAFNLFRRFLGERYPAIRIWRSAWARRAIMLRPGRLVRSARRTSLRTQPVTIPMLN